MKSMVEMQSATAVIRRGKNHEERDHRTRI